MVEEKLATYEQRLRDDCRSDARFEVLYELILEGKAAEKNNDVPSAILYYEKVIEWNFEGNYPYDRLAVIYRKKTDRENEIRVLNKAIEVFRVLLPKTQRSDVKPKLERFEEQLRKALRSNK